MIIINKKIIINKSCKLLYIKNKKMKRFNFQKKEKKALEENKNTNKLKNNNKKNNEKEKYNNIFSYKLKFLSRQKKAEKKDESTYNQSAFPIKTEKEKEKKIRIHTNKSISNIKKNIITEIPINKISIQNTKKNRNQSVTTKRISPQKIQETQFQFTIQRKNRNQSVTTKRVSPKKIQETRFQFTIHKKNRNMSAIIKNILPENLNKEISNQNIKKKPEIGKNTIIFKEQKEESNKKEIINELKDKNIFKNIKISLNNNAINNQDKHEIKKNDEVKKEKKGEEKEKVKQHEVKNENKEKDKKYLKGDEKIKEKEYKIENQKNGRINILAKLDREKLKKIVSSCPKRTSISLNNFREHLKKVTNNLTEEEKAYTLFYWMSQNIKYDAEGYFSGVYHVEPEETYNRGCSVCSGYSRLFKYIGVYIGLDVICISGYAKGYGYDPSQKISGTNHEWNIIKFKKVYYQIDSTWGAGTLNGNEFKQELREFYFCPEPEQLISSHLPEEDKWQLIYPPLSEEEFGKRVKFYEKFFGFFTTDLKYHTFKVKSKHTIRFNKIDENVNVGAILRVFDKQGRETNNAKGLILYDKKYIDFFYIFKKKGTYKTTIYADYAINKLKNEMVTYYLECEEDYKETPGTPFSLPENGNNEITIIEPIYNILKKGNKVTLKFKSDVTDEITVTNGQWLTIKKNKDGIFETTITIDTDEVFIGIPKKEGSSSFDTCITYKVN